MLNDSIYKIKKEIQWMDVEIGDIKVNKFFEKTGKTPIYFSNISMAQSFLKLAKICLEKAQKDFDGGMQ